MGWGAGEVVCRPPLPLPGTVWGGKQQILHGGRGGREEGDLGGISFIERNPASLPALAPIP